MRYSLAVIFIMNILFIANILYGFYIRDMIYDGYIKNIINMIDIVDIIDIVNI